MPDKCLPDKLLQTRVQERRLTERARYLAENLSTNRLATGNQRLALNTIQQSHLA